MFTAYILVSPSNLVRSAALTAFGLIGNAYSHGRGWSFDSQRQERHQTIKVNARGLLLKQEKLKLQDMAVVEKRMMDCGKKK